MVISKCSNLVCRKRQVQTRFNVFLSPFVAYKAVQLLSVYTMSDPHRQLSSYFMVEYHESLIMFRRIWSPLHLNQQRLSHYWIVAYFALHQNTWTIAAWPWILCSAVRYLFVTQCCHPILAGRGRGISILIRKEHTIAVITVISGLTCKRGERVNFALCWPVRLVCLPFETKEYLTEGATVITAISKNFVRLLQRFFFCSNRPRSMYY